MVIPSSFQVKSKIETIESHVVDHILNTLSDYPGQVPVVIYAEKDKRKMMVKKTHFVTPGPTLVKALEGITGKETVIIR